ncbi:hypothetical protein [Microbacterium invictum]|uniref:Uncharacterized protein n=1 Tax=Microbacterium invictum TaxID=515415 RepID=A0AA40SM07_9MICO|nr:hypothetical protein [Microbacterium invictum]MBB4138700.1 hypothetical protein [Microbacterium invictum]
MDALMWLATTPTPSPTPVLPDPEAVTPGFAGFLAIAVLALAVVLLLIDMLRRIRRARYRSEIGEDLDAEAAALEAGAAEDRAIDSDEIPPTPPAKD